MKRLSWPVAAALLVIAAVLLYYRMANTFRPGHAGVAGPPPAPRGAGPTPAQLERWAAGAEAAEKQRLANIEKYRKQKAAPAPGPVPATERGE